jgi:hypothetical protein
MDTALSRGKVWNYWARDARLVRPWRMLLDEDAAVYAECQPKDASGVEISEGALRSFLEP